MSAPGAAGAELRCEVRPAWPFQLGGGGLDGVARFRGGVLERAVRTRAGSAVVRVAQPAAERVVFGARAGSTEAAAGAIAAMRAALGVDRDLRPFHDSFRDDPWIGPSVRSRPQLRPNGRPDPFEALAWAVCEQLIEYERAAAIERRILRRFGSAVPSWDGTRTLWLAPDAATVAALSAAELQACDLSAGRARALISAAREIVRGRIDLDAGDPRDGWRRLRAISGIGAWTVSVLALHGHQHYDALPAGDLAYRKLVGRLLRPQDGPHARAGEDEVAAAFERFAPWRGLAGLHALGVRASGGGAGLRFAA